MSKNIHRINDVRPFNKRGLPHGLWKNYWMTNGGCDLVYEGNFNHGKKYALWTYYNALGHISNSIYFIT